MKNLILLLFVSSLFWGCYKTPEIEGFKTSGWKESLNNCDGYRMQSVNLIKGSEGDLVGKNQNEIKKLLGGPSKHELYDRNQKFFNYYLDCDKTKELVIRFNALGRVQEIQVIESP